MILSFKKQFKDPILSGIKKHTIREDNTNRWEAGRMIQFATGVRTKNYNCFEMARCVSVQRFSIRYKIHPKETVVKVFINGKLKGDVLIENCVIKEITGCIKKLSQNDGFKDVNEFLEWFSEDFDGKIIHWTNLRY